MCPPQLRNVAFIAIRQQTAAVFRAVATCRSQCLSIEQEEQGKDDNLLKRRACLILLESGHLRPAPDHSGAPARTATLSAPPTKGVQLVRTKTGSYHGSSFRFLGPAHGELRKEHLRNSHASTSRFMHFVERDDGFSVHNDDHVFREATGMYH